MIPDLEWMIGLYITEVEKTDYTWFFSFDDGTAIGTEDCWRLVSMGRIAVTSEDHGHKFGLTCPVNAADVVKTEVNGKPVSHVEVDNCTGDLTLGIGSASLTLLCLSLGYEAWHLTHHGLELVCMGGGKVVQIT